MSLHAQLSPETINRLRKQQRNNTITSIIIALLLVILVGLIMFWFLMPSNSSYTDPIVAYPSTEEGQTEISEPKVQRTVNSTPSTPTASAATAKVLTSSNNTNVFAPPVEEYTDAEAADFSSATFNENWGSASAGATGPSASFFDTKVNGDKILFIIDYSLSMKSRKKVNLMKEELVKSVKNLSSGSKYQLMFFAGPVWLASDKIGNVQGSKTNTITTAEGKTLKWSKNKTNGKVRKVDWLTVSKQTIDNSIKQIKKSPLVLGTTWSPSLEMAFEMSPKPDAIIFMTDGATKDASKTASTYGLLAKKHGIPISAIALMEPGARDGMITLAKESGGSFAIINAKGQKEESDNFGK